MRSSKNCQEFSRAKATRFEVISSFPARTECERWPGPVATRRSFVAGGKLGLGWEPYRIHPEVFATEHCGCYFGMHDTALSWDFCQI